MSNSLPIRPPHMPHMPMNDLHRSCPPSPYDPSHRDPRVMTTGFDPCRLGMDGPDYFAAMGMGPFRDRPPAHSPFTPGFDPDMMLAETHQNTDDLVRRTNLLVQFVNGQLTYSARYSQLQPKMCPDGRFPIDFRTPKTVEEVRVMDPLALDRILRAYGLPTDLRSLRLNSQDVVSSRTAQQAKLCTLFDFLGAMQISERQRMKRQCLPY